MLLHLFLQTPTSPENKQHELSSSYEERMRKLDKNISQDTERNQDNS